MEEDPGGAIIAMKAKDPRENLSPSRGQAREEEAQGENLSSSLSVAPECHRKGNHHRGDRLHQHHHHHHHPHLCYTVHAPAPRVGERSRKQKKFLRFTKINLWSQLATRGECIYIPL